MDMTAFVSRNSVISLTDPIEFSRSGEHTPPSLEDMKSLNPGCVPGQIGITLVITFLAALLALPVKAEDKSAVFFSDYYISSWTPRNGLPSESVWAIAQDVDGYL